MTMTVDCLSLRLQGRNLLKNISFSLKKGSITGLLGSNGAGKTSTFLSLIGLYRTSRGKVFLEGEDISSLPMYKRAQKGIGYLCQEPSLFRELTVEENLLTFLEITKATKKEKQVILEQKLNELNILHLRKKKASHLSGGEKRRVEIARTLTTNPKILFLDEPFANIDPKSIEDVKNLISLLAKKNITIFITDHNATELLSFIDYGILLENGSILAQGTPSHLLQDQKVKLHYLGNNFKLNI